jgi:hypothetical protein
MSSGKANLTFYIYEGLLTGYLNGQFVIFSAKSGGGGASKLGITDSSVVNNPDKIEKKMGYVKKEDAKKENRGGPIPPGTYKILKPVSWGKSKKAVIEPLGTTMELLKKIGRGGFLFHARGNYGSDGCIVPDSWEAYLKLMEGLETDAGGTLQVYDALSQDRIPK